MSDLPPGFVLDAPAKAPGLPPGFVLDEHPSDSGRTAARVTGQVAQNVNDVIADTVAAPFNLAAGLTNKIGLTSGPSPVGPAVKSGIDYIATLPGRVKDAVTQGSTDPFTESRTSRFEPETRGEKIGAGLGQGLGAVATTLLPAAAVAKAATAGSMTERLASALASQPAMQTVSGAVGGATTGATDNPYAGLAAALAVPGAASIARGVVSPVRNVLNTNEQAIVDSAKKAGIPLTPSQETGSKTLRAVEETMAKLPLSDGPMQAAYGDQRAAFNKAVLGKAGVDATEAGPATLTKAFDKAGETFDDLAARTTVKPDAKFAQDLTDVAQNYGRRLPTDVAPVFKSYLDDLEPIVQAVQQGQSPQLLGEAYKNMRSDITTRIRNSNDGDLKRALGGIVEALDGAMERGATGSLAKEWKDARRQYSALMTANDAMSAGTQADRAAGNIPLGAFSSAVRRSDKAGFARGRGQFGELANTADFLAPKVPDSGTATRGFVANALTGGTLFGGAAATGAGLPAAFAAALGPYAASKIYNTPLARAYLTNQAAGSTSFGPLLAAETERQGVLANSDMHGLARALMQRNQRSAR